MNDVIGDFMMDADEAALAVQTMRSDDAAEMLRARDEEIKRRTQARTTMMLLRMIENLEEHRMIDAIKAFREATGLGLQEAKGVVERIRDTSRPDTPAPTAGKLLVLRKAEASDAGQRDPEWILDSTYVGDMKGDLSFDRARELVSLGYRDVQLVEVRGETHSVFDYG